ncbi:MAG: hypothetical protein M3P96_06705 [Actinomycetota bacterium]|nr:hypothetical protein [Actinomycetota bacterium]
MTTTTAPAVTHQPGCAVPDVEAYGLTDASGTRALIVRCRTCRASAAGP